MQDYRLVVDAEYGGVRLGERGEVARGLRGSPKSVAIGRLTFASCDILCGCPRRDRPRGW
jgi:hypothetical protein